MKLRQMLSQVKAVMGITHGSRAFGGPIQANISLTNRCNIKCIHCYLFSPYLKGPKLSEVRETKLSDFESPNNKCAEYLQRLDADSDRINALIDELLKMGTRSFMFTGSGEPFLHKNILEFMDRSKHAGSSCLVNTNGTLLDRATIDELIKMGFDKLTITMMSGSRNMYLKTHPGVRVETFDHLRNNLLYLAEQKAFLRVRRPKVSLVYIIIAQNYNGLIDFAEFASLVQADQVIFRPVDEFEDRGLTKLVPTTEQAAYVRKQLKEVKSYLESENIDHNISNFLKVFRELLDTTILYHVIPCYIGWLWVRVLVDGNVYPCCRCYKPLGNIYEKQFHEIWNGHTYRKFRTEAVHIKNRNTPVSGCNCNSCHNYAANLRVYRLLHPLKGRTARVESLFPAFPGDGE